MVNQLHVLLIGAGPTGLLLAQGLKKAGIKCTVFEKARTINEGRRDWNFGITWGQAGLSDCLPEELYSALQTAQVDRQIPSLEDTIKMFNAKTMEKIREFPTPFYLRLGKNRLVELLSTGINIQYGKQLSGIQIQQQEVVANFGDGTSAKGDLLVGCDGAHSTVRDYLLGAQKAALKQLPIWGTWAIATLPADLALKHQEAHSRLLIGYHPDGLCVFIAVHDAVEKENPEDWVFQLHQSWIQEGPVNLSGEEALVQMKMRADTCEEPIRSVFKAIPDGTKIWHNQLTYWATEPWDNRGGRVTLAGDAAHSMTFHRGQGYNNGIEDVASLIQELCKIGEKHDPKALEQALHQYEKDVWIRGKDAVKSNNDNSLMLLDWERLASSRMFITGPGEK